MSKITVEMIRAELARIEGASEADSKDCLTVLDIRGLLHIGEKAAKRVFNLLLSGGKTESRSIKRRDKIGRPHSVRGLFWADKSHARDTKTKSKGGKRGGRAPLLRAQKAKNGKRDRQPVR